MTSHLEIYSLGNIVFCYVKIKFDLNMIADIIFLKNIKDKNVSIFINVITNTCFHEKLATCKWDNVKSHFSKLCIVCA